MTTPPRHVHVAVVMREYAELILAGKKTVEARLTVQARPPWGVVTPGERVYFKIRSGPVAVTAVVSGVTSVRPEGAAGVAQLRDEWEPRVLGGDAYWAERGKARYATLVEVRDPEAVEYGPPGAVPGGMANRSAWRLLPLEADVWPGCVSKRLGSIETPVRGGGGAAIGERGGGLAKEHDCVLGRLAIGDVSLGSGER